MVTNHNFIQIKPFPYIDQPSEGLCITTKANLREPNLLYLVGSAILCRFRKSESFRLYPVQKCIVSKNARGRVKEGGPLQTRFLGVFKFKNELFHWIRLNLLMEFEGLFVKFGARVLLFWEDLGYSGYLGYLGYIIWRAFVPDEIFWANFAVKSWYLYTLLIHVSLCCPLCTVMALRASKHVLNSSKIW